MFLRHPLFLNDERKGHLNVGVSLQINLASSNDSLVMLSDH